MHLVISDGQINTRNLELAGKDTDWLKSVLSTHGLTAREVFMLLVDDGGKVRIFLKKEDASPPKR